jgi:hypothetical protein
MFPLGKRSAAHRKSMIDINLEQFTAPFLPFSNTKKGSASRAATPYL